MSNEVRECPSCGSSELGFMRIEEVHGLNWYQVSCRTCGARAKCKTSPEDAIASWNEKADLVSKLTAGAPLMNKLLKTCVNIQGDQTLKDTQDIARKHLARLDREKAGE